MSNCPRCGLSPLRYACPDVRTGEYHGSCRQCSGTGYITHTTDGVDCLRNQLAAANAEIERLKKDQGDWRKGVALIASAIGEKEPPDLSCVRIAMAIMELLAERDAEIKRLRAAAEAAYKFIGEANIVGVFPVRCQLFDAIEKARKA